MSFSARDIATDLLESGARPYVEMRELDEAMASPDPAAILGRMTAAVMRCSARELGVVVTNPDALAFNSREAAFITGLLSKGSN